MKILIIGLGSIGKKHVSSIRLLYPDTEIVALRSAKDADSYPGITNVYSIDEVASASFNFAIIANPTSEHLNTISELLDFNLPLFIEKPIYYSLDIEAIVNLAVSKEIQTYVACNLRFLDSIKFIKDQISYPYMKKLNEVNVYCGSYMPDWRTNVDYRKLYSANANLGGGVHLDLIHELDYLYWLFGKPNKVIRTFRNQSTLSINSYDYANYLLIYESFCVNVILNYYRRDPKRNCELVFDGETWYIDLLTNQVTSKNQVLYSSKQTISDTYVEQMSYFINTISNKEKTFNTISDGFNVLKICLGENDTQG